MLVSTFFDYSKSDPAIQEFVKAYQAPIAGGNPDWFAANWYDVIMIAAGRQERGQERPYRHQRRPRHDRYVPGHLRPHHVRENGDVLKPLSIVIVQRRRPDDGSPAADSRNDPHGRREGEGPAPLAPACHRKLTTPLDQRTS